MCPAETPEDAVETGRQVWTQIVRDAVHASADTEIAEDCGLPQVLARIEREGHPQPEKTLPARTDRIAHLRQLLRQFFRHGFGPGLAFACLVIVFQGGVIAHLWPANSAPEFAIVRTLPGSGGHHEPFIRVAFQPETTEQALRVLLTGVQADIVAGPTQLGDYYLLVAPGLADAVVQVLAENRIVESAVLVDSLPGDN
jgi:hypothetical protein